MDQKNRDPLQVSLIIAKPFSHNRIGEDDVGMLIQNEQKILDRAEEDVQVRAFLTDAIRKTCAGDGSADLRRNGL